MRIGQKLILGYLVIALFVVVGGGIAVKVSTEVMKGIDTIVLSNFAEVEAATEIAYLIQKTESEMQAEFLHPIEEYKHPQHHIEQLKEKINTSISLIEKIILLWEDAIKTGYKLSVEKEKEEKELKKIKTLKTNLNSLILLIYKTIVILEERGYEEAEEFYHNETEPLLGKMQYIAKSLEEETEEEMIIGMGKIRTASQNTIKYSIIETIIIFLGAMSLGYFISKSITKPIKKLRDATAEIGKGNLDIQDIKVRSNDEMGELAVSFQKMTADLKRTTTSIDNLNKEITGRVRTQEELKKHHDNLEEIVAELKKREEQLQQEINERKRLEESLRIKNSAIASSINAIALADLEGNLTYINHSFLKLWGYEDDKEILGKPAIEFWQLKDNAVEVMEALRDKGGWSGELVARRKDSSLFNIQLLASIVTDEAAKPICMMSSFMDITERVRAEEALRKRTEALERSNQELEQFAYVASHDLQEPLRMVVSYTQLLAKRYKGKLDSDAEEFIAYAVDGATSMQMLINDLLEYSRVGNRGKDFESTDCEAVLERTLTSLQKAVEGSGAKVTHDPLPTVMADVMQLGQLFQNLIGNAIKFHGEEPPDIHVSVKKSRNEWVFSVRDNGSGIEPEFHERIFIIFQRLHKRRESPGTGIGLAICKKIVERHDGRIWVESEPGKGSTFYFTIPLRGGDNHG